MKKLILFLSLIPLLLQSKTIVVKYPGATKDGAIAINAAIQSATAADSIVPQSGYPWGILSKIIINKPIAYFGSATALRTEMYRPESMTDAQLTSIVDMIVVDIPGYDGVIEIAGLSLRSKKTNGDSISRGEDDAIRGKCKLKINNCAFERFGYAAVCIIHDDLTAYGIMYNCEVYGVKGKDGLGLGYGVVVRGADKIWKDSPEFGSFNFFFVEDCSFYFTRHSVDGSGGALITFRRNKVVNNIAAIDESSGAAISTHAAKLSGPGTGNNFAIRAYDFYDNDVIFTVTFNGTPIEKAKDSDQRMQHGINPRGGEGLIHDNRTTNCRFGVTLYTDNLASVGPNYPNIYGPGYLSGLQCGPNHTGLLDSLHTRGDLFIWNNVHKGSGTGQADFFNGNKDLFVEKRDYWFMPRPGYKPAGKHPLHT